MNPSDEHAHRRSGTLLSNQPRPLTPPARDYSSSQAAAADVIRSQIDSIYSGNSQENTPHTTPAIQIQADSPQAQPETVVTTRPDPQPHALSTAPQPSRTPEPESRQTDQAQSVQAQTAHHPQATADEWKQYHSAWQKYYQMYYERYYANHLQAQQAEFDKLRNAQSTQQVIGSAASATEPEDSEKSAIRRLRSQIQDKVKTQAKKLSKSRHFVPITAGVTVFLAIMVIQFNQPVVAFFQSYTTPGSIDPQNIIASSSTDLNVGSEPRLIIPRINVDMPVVYGVNAADQNAQLKAMENGAVHFSIIGASAVPGQIGNAVFAAHSSNDAFAPGKYKSAFIHNEKLTKGDIIYANYQGKRYTYSVTKSEVVMPNEVSRVQVQTDKPLLTLVSCVPIGTAQKRLLVFAEQISPDPANNQAKAEESTAQSADIPGRSSPTLLEKLFGAR